MARKFVSLFCIPYYSFIFYVVFLARRRRGPALAENERFVSIPGKNILQFLKESDHTLKDYFSFYTNLIGNIIMFIPFPFFLWLIFGVKDCRKIIIITCSISILIECIQYLLKIGVADVDDVLLNTFGCVIGLVIISNSIIRKNLVSVFPEVSNFNNSKETA